jgi:hypothetical protein
MRNPRLLLTILASSFLLLTPAAFGQFFELCTVSDAKTHYDVVLNFEGGASHRQVGEAYGARIRQVAPDFERLVDSYINLGDSWIIYKILLYRVNQLKPAMAQEYRDEIEGIASQLSGGDNNRPGDGKLSVDELYLFNMIGDVARLYQCSALGVYGGTSSDGKTIIGRNFDWPDGKDNQIAKLQAVITYRNGPRSFVNVGCLGFQVAISAFNTSRVFAAVLDSPTGSKYTAKNKRPYLLDLRTAIENSSTLQDVAAHMTDPNKQYTSNHLIMLADADTCGVLENDFSKSCKTCHRQLRSALSELRPGVSWDVADSVGTVNCFLLQGNEDNHLDPTDKKDAKKGEPPADVNIPRWQTMLDQLKSHGPKIDMTAMQQIMNFYHKDKNTWDIRKGDLYNSFTMQSIVFEPATFDLRVYFRPRDGKSPARMNFEPIAVKMVE